LALDELKIRARDVVESDGFDTKMNFAVGLGLITQAGRKQLMELNTMRNRCSHNWVLEPSGSSRQAPSATQAAITPVPRQRPSQSARGISEFTVVYLRLYAKWMQ
jgi:hypothetical protein